MTRAPRPFGIALALALLGLAQAVAAPALAEEGAPYRPPLAAPAEVEIPPGGRLPAGTLFGGWAIAFDGDTLALVQGADSLEALLDAPARGPRRRVRVRLFALSAPEMRDYRLGLAGRTALDDAIGFDPVRGVRRRDGTGGRVVCTATGAVTHKRPVAVCRNVVGDDLAEALLRAGAGIVYRTYLTDRPDLARRYLLAESSARLHGRGLWSAQPLDPLAGR